MFIKLFNSLRQGGAVAKREFSDNPHCNINAAMESVREEGKRIRESAVKIAGLTLVEVPTHMLFTESDKKPLANARVKKGKKPRLQKIDYNPIPVYFHTKDQCFYVIGNESLAKKISSAGYLQIACKLYPIKEAGTILKWKRGRRRVPKPYTPAQRLLADYKAGVEDAILIMDVLTRYGIIICVQRAKLNQPNRVISCILLLRELVKEYGIGILEQVFSLITDLGWLDLKKGLSQQVVFSLSKLIADGDWEVMKEYLHDKTPIDLIEIASSKFPGIKSEERLLHLLVEIRNGYHPAA